MIYIHIRSWKVLFGYQVELAVEQYERSSQDVKSLSVSG